MQLIVLEKVDAFKYLGTATQSNYGCGVEVSRRIQSIEDKRCLQK